MDVVVHREKLATYPTLLDELQISLPYVALTAPVLCLGLSRRARNCLERAHLVTVGKVASATSFELAGLRNFGAKSLLEVQEKLRQFAGIWECGPSQAEWARIADIPIEAMGLAEGTQMALLRLGLTRVGHLRGLTVEDLTDTGYLDVFSAREALRTLARLLGEKESSPHRPCEPTGQELGTPIDRLGLSLRPRNALLRARVMTVEQLEALSDEELLSIRNLGRKSLAEVRQRLAEYLLRPCDPNPAPDLHRAQPNEPSALVAPAYKAILARPAIGISRLGLDAQETARLIASGIDTIQKLVHDAAGFSQSRPEVLEQLRIYTDWLLAQGEDALKQEALGLELNPFQREALARQTLEEVVDAWLSFVGERNTRIVRLRLGLQGEPQTLEEIGRQLGLTRERIRQLQGKSFRILQHHLRVKVVAPLRLLLQEVLAEAGGVMTSERLARALAHAVPPGAVDPAAVIRLIAEAGSFSGWNDELGVWVHPNHDLAHVRQIWEALRDLLSEYPLGLSRTELIQRLRERQAPGGQGSAWDDAFISVCLRTCPGLRHDPRTGDWYLKGRVRPRTRQIALALRRIGRPAHYREIAAEVNAHLGPGKAMASSSVRARLNSEPQYFAWVGKRGTYGLTEWGLTDLPKRGRGVVGAQSRAILATLRAHRRPMSLEELTSEANWRLPSHQHLTPEAARAILESETVRFPAVGDMYNLTEWAKEGRDSGTSRTPGADAGQGLSQAIGQILEMAGCALTAEQIAAQLPLLGLSPCLEEVVVALGRREFRALGDGRYCLEREIEIAEPSRGYRDEQGTLWGAAGPWTRASKSDADTGEWR